MKELINDKKPAESNTIDWSKIGADADVDELLKEYSDGGGMNIEPDPQPTAQPVNNIGGAGVTMGAQQSLQPTTGGGGPDDPTDKRFYYVRGKKKGQRRDKPYIQATYTPPPNQTATISGQFITGSLFLLLIDLLIPMIIGLLNDRFSKTKIDVSKLKLTAEQKRELDPIADAVVKHINFTANPVLLLTISLAGVYGLNYMGLIQSEKLKQQLKQQKNENSNQVNTKVESR